MTDRQQDIERLAALCGLRRVDYRFGWWVDSKGCDVCRVDDWNPWSSWHDAGMVLEKLRYNWSLIRDVGNDSDRYETTGDMKYRFVLAAPGLPMAGFVADTGPAAIAEAALKVWDA